MGPRAGLSRQILIAMSAITVTAGLLVFFGTYLAYTAIVALYPMPEQDGGLTSLDFVIVGALILVTLPIAALVSLRLARRILEPLESLALSARRITAGDLTARASAADRALGETAVLIDDFNTMAQRLQDMAADMALWNATIAHELRTPLTILKGRLQGMIDGVFEPDERSLQGLILQVDGLARLVEDLRTVTLADSGHLDLHIEPIRLAWEIEQMAEFMAHDLRAGGFRLELDLADLVVDADAARIRQALLALVTNARRYAVRGTITLRLAEHDGEIRLSVADEGPGLSPEMAARVFDPFVRGDAVRSRELGGNGLGLSVVRAIVEAHGGRLRYRRAPEGGALFEMVFAKTKRSSVAHDA
ncbi:MAG: two-component sensor histidine kinase [Mesorhizobium sp. 65-26]|jgi:two-component system sensor histidine kinase AdeS|nr:HAMP domain-containing histidine kinase [Mesorhizobium sp.]ODT12853.1 MAG: two-component sensor histidine kinase [Mesorhizobium sp. SCN 65-12]OJX76042.1 MAG: two-component sensor histidine kinase [Mesorhizobium sp. 65-26]